MRLLLLAFLLALPTIFALPSPQAIESKSFSTLFSRFTSLLSPWGPQNSEDPRLLSGHESEDQHDPSLLRGGATEISHEKRFKSSSSYPKCKSEGKRNGYAHYPGWKIVGDDLSGALPVKPRDNCIHVCDVYGDACAGTFFDDATNKCFLKGNKVQNWEFVETDQEGDSVDLIGGCAAWSEAVPEEMDDICCRD